jgi:hypothetical protein
MRYWWSMSNERNDVVRNVVMSKEASTHPLIAGRHFFTLPLTLLESVVANVGQSKFYTELLTLERELAKRNGDHSSTLVFMPEFRSATPYSTMHLPAAVIWQT